MMKISKERKAAYEAYRDAVVAVWDCIFDDLGVQELNKRRAEYAKVADRWLWDFAGMPIIEEQGMDAEIQHYLEVNANE